MGSASGAAVPQSPSGGEGQPGEALFLSAGHCWHATYDRPQDAHVIWAMSHELIDVLMGKVKDDRPTPRYPVESLDVPAVGDVHTATAMIGEVAQPLRLVFRRALGADVYVYTIARCLVGATSGAPRPDRRREVGRDRLCIQHVLRPSICVSNGNALPDSTGLETWRTERTTIPTDSDVKKALQVTGVNEPETLC